MTIKEIYELAKALGIEDIPCVFPNRDYEYGYNPFIMSDSVQFSERNGFAVITGDTEVGREDDDFDDEIEDDYQYLDREISY